MTDARTTEASSPSGAAEEEFDSGWKRFGQWLRHNICRLSAAVMLICCTMSIIALGARHWWVADTGANLRVQLMIGLAVVIVVFSLERRWSLVAMAVVAAGTHVPFVMSAIQGPETSVATPLLSVVTANVFTANRRYSDIEAELLRSDADVVAVLELSPDLHEYLQRDFAKQYRWSRVEPKGVSNFGIGLYSRIPFDFATLDYFNDERISSIIAQFTIDGEQVQVIATHTLPPLGTRGFEHRNRHLNMLCDSVRQMQADNAGGHVVVLGDLNLTPWSPLFEDFLMKSGLQNVACGRGLTPTWYRYRAFPFGLKLDHILVSEHLACDCYRVGTDIGSDHRCVTADIGLAHP